MKQVTQSLANGSIDSEEVPASSSRPGYLLIKSLYSLVSSGTERMLVDFGQSSYLQKAKQQPDKVKEVIQKVKTDGVFSTYEAIKSKLDQPIPMGYCNVGVVIQAGANTDGFAVGDCVVSNGSHAEIVAVPKHLCAKVPENVLPNQAVFTVLGAIALQGVRLLQPQLGECVVVFGLGMVGLLTVQILRAHGCRVIGIDYSQERLALAKQYGAETINLSQISDPVNSVMAKIDQSGVDGVIIAAATKSNDPVSQAAQMSRKRGRIILVGVSGLNLSRADFFEKELTFQVSCSYGPGRYDPAYEEKGQDYPIGFVRWTEQRNFQAVLHAMEQGWLDVSQLVTHQFTIDSVKSAYEVLMNDASALGILIEYPHDTEDKLAMRQQDRTVTLQYDDAEIQKKSVSKEAPRVAVIGAGNYASRVLIPAFRQTPAALKLVCANSGLNAHYVGKKEGVSKVSTDTQQIWDDQDLDVVVIATRHNTHADFVCRAIESEKHVFVEKPLALSLSELERISQSYKARASSVKVMVGFNRRFSPFIQKMKSLLIAHAQPMTIMMTINAGSIPAEHWTQDRAIGGGRIVGEACHFIDLARYLTGSKITGSNISYLEVKGGSGDTAIINLSFSDGSVAAIHYLANGHKSIVKERIEIFTGGKVLRLNNFRKLEGYGWKGFKKMRSMKQDKGQSACVSAFVDWVSKDGIPPIPFDELIEISRVSIELAGSTVA